LAIVLNDDQQGHLSNWRHQHTVAQEETFNDTLKESSAGMSDLEDPGDANAGWGALARARALKTRLKAGETVIGGWLSLTDPVVAELMARVGFDFLLIDTEHGPWDLIALQTALMGFNGTGAVPMVRAAWNDHVRIKQLLDMGFEGVMAPMVRTVEECRALVRACRYPPAGARGFGPRRASNYYRNVEKYVSAANEAIFVMPQIEDVATVDVIEEYLAVPGIDAVALGPNDLSGSTGFFLQHSHPANTSAIDKVLDRAKAAGIPVCLGVTSKPSDQKELSARGVRLLLATFDVDLLASGARAALESSRRAIA
jgi:2-keto-3-deoxy-L-rhamnonate aldolase RhmA